MGFKINFNVALVQKVIQFQSGSDKDDGNQEKKDKKPAVEDNGEEKKREKKREKEVVIIQGKALAKYLKRKLKKAVVFVHVNENGGGAGEEEKEREKNGAPVNSICPYGCPNPMEYPNMRPNGYGSGYLAATEQMFSDENPNACSVM
ncbi:hypothetical protein RHSIM_Rhsim10G0042500 [Rhododendron simsii]|uniref:Uncharacterized protein n=1 Tax=Rhododendron simsii TaxID=118357 RepID=A0A834GBS6_RHOSS|nr:hypothetical protein RHSIM_Rhsim10G0042500 [Rhododendron simsii]